MATVYVFDPNTKELRGSTEVRDGTNYPATHKSRTFVVPPDDEAGMKQVWDADTQSWSQVEDHRQDTVYRRADGSEDKVQDLGPIPNTLTTIARPSIWHSWDDRTDGWAEDMAAKDAASAEGARQAELRASSYVSDWDGRIKGKTYAEIKDLYDKATAQQKSDLLFYLLIVRALEVKA